MRTGSAGVNGQLRPMLVEKRRPTEFEPTQPPRGNLDAVHAGGTFHEPETNGAHSRVVFNDAFGEIRRRRPVERKAALAS